MTATNHAITGATIAVVIYGVWSWPWPLALTLALASHFICDAIPHWDYLLKFPLKKYVAITDIFIAGLVALSAALLAYGIPFWIVVTGAALAIIPDAMWLPHILKNNPIPFDGDKPLYLARRFHRWIQWSETKRGFYVEIAWFCLMLFVLAHAITQFIK
jgi:hypothetical protein